MNLRKFTTEQLANYDFEDPLSPPGNWAYQLKQTCSHGSLKSSQTVFKDIDSVKYNGGTARIPKLTKLEVYGGEQGKEAYVSSI